MSEWISVEDALPPTERKVLATFVNGYGKRRTICAHHISRFTVESDGEFETNDEYNEEKDEYYLCEGWYENIENWGDFSSVFVCEGDITHWMPLPEPPK